MKKILIIIGLVLAISGCASKQQIAQTLKENPEILSEAIKKNPSLFMASLREAAQADQLAMMQKQSSEREAQVEKDLKNPRPIKADDSRLIYGEAKAPITIIKYADFQCPACRMGYESLEEVKKKYPGKIKFVHKNVPLNIHPQAQLAAEIFEALVIIDKPKARAFYKAAYESQGQWRSSDQLWAVAKKIGADKNKIKAEIKKGEVNKRIDADVQEHEKLGFQGTPAYMVNGVAMYGAQPPEEFAAVIDKILKK